MRIVSLMLDLSQVLNDINNMGAEVQGRVKKVADQLTDAFNRANVSAEQWQAECQRLGRLESTPWLVAEPCKEPPGTVYKLPQNAPDIYTALATDGSHIPLDRHAVAPCYLVNVGEIALHYGTGERPRLTSNAALYYREEDIYSVSKDGETTPLSERMVTNQRLLAESKALNDLISECKDRKQVIALVDDPLIVWTPQGESDEQNRNIIDKFCELLETARRNHVPIAGYISRPGHRDVVGLLRLMSCPSDCDHQPDKECRKLASLADSQLYAKILTKRGDRSPIFASRAPNLKLYPKDHLIYFFYMNTGAEIARIEIPVWVAQNKEFRDSVQVLCYDQSDKGQGYPVALAEAHEHAVVRGPEREAFFRLVENALIRHDLPAMATRKAVSKRTRMI